MNPEFNENTVLDFVKTHLGHPFNIVEFEDDFLINEIICSNNYLNEFSRYFPKEERIILSDFNNTNSIRLGSDNSSSQENFNGIYNNRWKLKTKNQILGVKRVIESSLFGPNAIYTDMMMHTNPVSYNTDNFLLSMTKPVITHRFYHPNIVEVYGHFRTASLLCIVNVVHDNDLSSIPASLQMNYNKFCLYTAANFILGIRYKYQNMSTPFGEININIEWIQSLAEKKVDLINEFKHPANFNSRAEGIFVF